MECFEISFSLNGNSVPFVLPISRFVIRLQSINLFNCGMSSEFYFVLLKVWFPFLLSISPYFCDTGFNLLFFSNQRVGWTSGIWYPFFSRNLLTKWTIQIGKRKIFKDILISRVIKYDANCVRRKMLYINVYTMSTTQWCSNFYLILKNCA